MPLEDLRQLLRGLKAFAGDLSALDPFAAPDTPPERFPESLLAAVDAEGREPHRTK